jgi:hypothetical protein
VNNLPGTFTDISATGTVITSGDDVSAPFTSGVTNALVTTPNLFACTNGMVTDASFSSYTNGSLPVSGVGLGFFILWDDLYVDPPGSLKHQMVVEGGINVEVIQWNQVRTFDAGSSGPRGTFEIKIFASGPVFAQFIYQSPSFEGNGGSATIGVQATGNSYSQFSYNTATVSAGTVLSIVNAPSGACCLPNQGGCAITGSASCTAQGGTYHGDNSLCATANCPGPNQGPDVYIGDLTDVAYYGAVGSISAYAVGTDACNAGDAPVSWSSSNNQHPVIAQNMYRLVNGRFEQIGQSWLKHGFASTNSTFCGTCHQPPGGSSQLGVGCSDAYGAGLNGSQDLLGPRSQVNATTASYPYPFSAPPYSTAIDRRLQVFTADVTPAQNPNALYFVDAHYVTADDATWNNGLNNASYKQVSIPSQTATPTFIGGNHTFMPGIRGWKDQDAAVTLVTADYDDNGITARFWAAARATDNGNGTWHYEYAVYNHNANRNGGTFSVPVPAGAVLTNVGFHAPFSHSGEPYDNSPWTSSVANGHITFSTTPAATNPNANAIRWGTLYNFRFDANAAPTTGNAALGLFLPGTPASLAIAGVPVPGSAACYANCDGSTTPPVLNIGDFVCFQARFAAGDTYANCDGSTTPPVLTVNDFLCFQSAFVIGCP